MHQDPKYIKHLGFIWSEGIFYFLIQDQIKSSIGFLLLIKIIFWVRFRRDN